MMKLYGHYISVTTWQVLLTLAEKGLVARFEPVDVFGKAHKAPPHLKLHPFGHIPVLDDDGFLIYETHAILRYLERVSNCTTLVPTDARQCGRMDQWMCIEQNYLLPAAKKVMARGYAGMMGLPDPGPSIVDEGLSQLRFAIDRFADWIEDKVFITGDAYTLADIIWAADLSEMAQQIPGVRDRIEGNAQGWLLRIQERQSWRKAVQERESHKPLG